ncbi:hypothetical protein C826_01610 [Helicobacter bilis WiWa]|uniref:YopX protein domain-containing protein n=2 Tax=Helicobacter bilis TaxID=37372 RepID=N2BA43_9HELI|nr:YopX family protein [Helicobacter bilis]EMZ37546.1 hypothetical protein C826_02112 [Helicobacter bilis WiWa]EMZ38572.1 hypothetical protein C826_01610 [Helicobacter bilis WiWa]
MQLKDFDFRLWHNLSECFVEIRGGFLTANGKDEIVFEKSLIVPIDDENAEIELWSGFYDSKGTKLYEGDIVKYDSKTAPLVVVFERNTFYIIDTSIEKDLQVDCGTRLQCIYERSNGYKDNTIECVEVIGNIHENADLLKKRKSAYQM